MGTQYLRSQFQGIFKSLSEDVKDFCLQSSVPERFSPPKAIDFYREWVSFNRPVIYRKAISDWPALINWEKDTYIEEKMGNRPVTVSVTPNGYADAIVGDRFVMPLELSMTYREFIGRIRNPQKGKVHYVQRQNSNLKEEFAEIFSDIREIPWAAEAFNKDFDAVNFWIGDGRAVTSCHKDPYENIYCVVRGHKDIILHPPSDLPWVPYKLCQPSEYQETSEGFEIKDVNAQPIRWIDVDPLNPDLNLYPDYSRVTRLELRLEKGDVLYLPSLWFHHLRQSHGCIAVNFWYDMEYDPKFSHLSALQKFVDMRDSLPS